MRNSAWRRETSFPASAMSQPSSRPTTTARASGIDNARGNTHSTEVARSSGNACPVLSERSVVDVGGIALDTTARFNHPERPLDADLYQGNRRSRCKQQVTWQ